MNFVRSYASKLVDLPAPEDGIWKKEDVPDHIAEKLRLFESRNIITRVVDQDTARPEPKWQTPRNIWKALEALGAFNVHPHSLPCGHVGMRNRRDGKGYECRTCSQVFTRDEVVAAQERNHRVLNRDPARNE